MKTGR